MPDWVEVMLVCISRGVREVGGILLHFGAGGDQWGRS